MKDRGHPEMSAVAFKQKKYSWKREAMKMRQLWEAEGLKFWNSFLDAEPDDLDDDLGVAPTSVTKLVNQCYRERTLFPLIDARGLRVSSLSRIGYTLKAGVTASPSISPSTDYFFALMRTAAMGNDSSLRPNRAK